MPVDYKTDHIRPAVYPDHTNKAVSSRALKTELYSALNHHPKALQFLQPETKKLNIGQYHQLIAEHHLHRYIVNRWNPQKRHTHQFGLLLTKPQALKLKIWMSKNPSIDPRPLQLEWSNLEYTNFNNEKALQALITKNSTLLRKWLPYASYEIIDFLLYGRPISARALEMEQSK